MTVKERVLRRIAELDERQLEKLEARLDELREPLLEENERRLSAWRSVFGMLSDPRAYAEFEKRAERRHMFFGGGDHGLEAAEEIADQAENES